MSEATFSNSFWGINDMGVSVLLDRMRDAKTTNEEIGHFYKERVIIEEDYARKLASLAKRSIGSSEIGTLKTSLQVLAQETDSIAASHASIARQLKADLVDTHTLFAEKMLADRRSTQKGVEDLFRLKVQQQVELKKVRERRDTDMQAQEHSSETSVTAYTNALQQLTKTVDRWNAEWKGACEQFQKLEEGRIDTVKTGMWAYANIFSQACVTDDESCERLRVSLEKCDAAQDIAKFIELKATGNVIPTVPEATSGTARVQGRSGRTEAVAPSPKRSRSLAARTASVYETNGNEVTRSPEDYAASTKTINQYPLDGITQLCRSDSSATFGSNSTSMAGSYVTASSVYSSVPNSQGQTPNLNNASEGFPIREAPPGKLARKKSFIDRVDMWPRRSPSPTKPDTPKPLKAQKTGSSIFDALRPARSRSRASMRSDVHTNSLDQVQSQESVLHVGQNMLPIQSNDQYAAHQGHTSLDPIAAALEQLRMDVHSPSQGRQAPDQRMSKSYGDLSAPLQGPGAARGHRRFPSRSESSSPVLSSSTSFPERQHPNKYVSRSGTMSSLGAPPAAHSAAEMRNMTNEYTQKNASIFSTNSSNFDARDGTSHEVQSSGRGRPGSSYGAQTRQAPGNLRRSPSPNPSNFPAQNVAMQSQSPTRRPVSATSNGTIKRQPSRERSPSRSRAEQSMYEHRSQQVSDYYRSDQISHSDAQRHLSHDNGMSHSRSPRAQDRAPSRGMESSFADGRYSSSTNRHSLSATTSSRPAEHQVLRTRSKSFVDAPRQRAQFTRDGRPILAFVLALYDYQATIPEEIGFRQGDTLAIVDMREDGWWIGEIVDMSDAPRGLVPSNFFKRIESYR